MKKLIIILCLLVTNTLFAQNGSVTIKSNTGVATGSPSGAWFNVRDYGAIADGVTNNTTAIQNTINAAAVNGGVVYFPSSSKGVYKTNKLTTYLNVKIQGDGYNGDTIRSIGADTLFVLHNVNTQKYWSNQLIEGVTLDGNSIGTVGFYTDGVANFSLGRTLFNKFTNTGLLLRSSLIGVINNCYFNNCFNAIKGYAGGGDLNATNLVTFNSCVINGFTKTAIDWSGGGQLILNTINIENGGTAQDTTSCAINYHDNTWPGGLHIYGGWFEANNTGTLINIQNNIGNNFGSGYPSYNVCSIDGLMDLGHYNVFPKRNIYISGANQRLKISNSYITRAVNNIISDGTNNITTVSNSVFDVTNITRNGATITNAVTQ